jgi:hypothetical protein
VVEHGDGTITVDGEIKVTNGCMAWIGWLENGVWRRKG